MCSCCLLGGIAQADHKPAERVDVAGALSENHHKNVWWKIHCFGPFLTV